MDIPANKRCLLIHVGGGLGNRLRTILSALNIAELAGRAPILFWVPKKNCKVDFCQLFSADTAAWLNVFSRDPLDNEWDLAMRAQYCTPALIKSSVPRVLVRSNKIIGDQKLVDWKKLFTKFELNEDIALIASTKLAEMPKQLKGHLGVHVRRGDHKAACAIPIEAYYAVADKWNGPLYLAADSTLARQQFYTRYGARVAMLGVRSLKRYKYEGIQDAFVDMLLLSRCKSVCGLITSSFGRMAARIGNKPFIDVGVV